MGDNTIVNDKLMAYSFIMVHEGYPCIFWYDYYNNGLARPGTPNGIDALIQAHHKYAGGDSQILHADPDLYIMQRVGWKDETRSAGADLCAEQPGRQVVRHPVKTKWANQKFVPIAWDGHDDASRRAHHRCGGQRRVPCPAARLRDLRAGVARLLAQWLCESNKARPSIRFERRRLNGHCKYKLAKSSATIVVRLVFL